MRDIVIGNLQAKLNAYDDLMIRIDDESLKQNLQVEKSKSLGEHLWCIVGARESYGRAIAAGSWQGYDCSLKELSVGSVVKALTRSKEAVLETVSGVEGWNEAQDQLLIDLLEHETMHEGQIIRLLYGLGDKPPDSWKWA